MYMYVYIYILFIHVHMYKMCIYVDTYISDYLYFQLPLNDWIFHGSVRTWSKCKNASAFRRCPRRPAQFHRRPWRRSVALGDPSLVSIKWSCWMEKPKVTLGNQDTFWKPQSFDTALKCRHSLLRRKFDDSFSLSSQCPLHTYLGCKKIACKDL